MGDYYSVGGYAFNPVSDKSVARVLAHRNGKDTWTNLTDSSPIFQNQQRKWLESMGPKNMYFEVTYNTNFIGIARITDVNYANSNACVGLDIYEKQRGDGHGSNVFPIIVKYCFGTLNLKRLWLLTREDNMAAIKIYMKSGFVEEGIMRQHLYKDGRYYDYILMGLLRKEWEDDTSIQGFDGSKRK